MRLPIGDAPIPISIPIGQQLHSEQDPA